MSINNQFKIIIAIDLFYFLLGFIIFIILGTETGIEAAQRKGMDVPRWWLLAVSLYSFVAAFGLWRKTSWGRILHYPLALVSLINIPLGTVFGIYLFIFLSKPTTQKYFK